jgi:putative endonuclease
MNRLLTRSEMKINEQFTNSRFLYFITNPNRSEIKVGITHDLITVAKNCQNALELFPEIMNTRSRLIYFEEYNDEQKLRERFTFLSRSTRAQKEKIIRKINPDWVDLSVGLLHEGIITSSALKNSVSKSDFNYN